MTEHTTPSTAAADEAAATASDDNNEPRPPHIARVLGLLMGPDEGWAPFVEMEVHDNIDGHDPVLVHLIPSQAFEVGMQLIRAAEASAWPAAIAATMSRGGAGGLEITQDMIEDTLLEVTATRQRFEQIDKAEPMADVDVAAANERLRQARANLESIQTSDELFDKLHSLGEALLADDTLPADARAVVEQAQANLVEHRHDPIVFCACGHHKIEHPRGACIHCSCNAFQDAD